MEGVVAPVLSQRMRSAAARQSSGAPQACQHQLLLAERVREIAPWLTPTQMQAVRPPTQLLYLAAVRDLLVRLGLASVPAWERTQWDEKLVHVLETMAEEQLGPTAGSRACSALLWIRPQLGKPMKSALPAACAVLRGWQRVQPGSSRAPLPYIAALGVAWELLDMESPVAAMTVMSLIETYARPSALLSLRGFQFVEPVPGAGMPQHLGFCFNAEELGQPSKTGEYDCTVLLDLERQEWMPQVLRELRYQSGENGLLFPIAYAELSRLFKLAVLRAGLQVLEPTLYTLRHGGASHDCGAKLRCRSTIKA